MLAWGAPEASGSGVRAIALDALGAPHGEEVVVATGADAPGNVEDVVATASASRVAVAWIVGAGSSASVRATVSSAGLDAFAPPRALGSSVASHDGGARGRLTAWTGSDGVSAIGHRLGDARCGAVPGSCARFARTVLGQAAGEGGDALEVPDPCDSLIVGAAARGTAFFHAVCHGTEAPSTTLYAIDAEVSLASAHEVLAGCLPLGLAPGATGVVLSGRCADGLALVEVGPRGDILANLRAATATVRCENGRPILRYAGTGELTLPLGAPVSRIESLLPETVAAPGARAVWTGEAVLSAHVSAGEVAVDRFQCELSELVRSFR